MKLAAATLPLLLASCAPAVVGTQGALGSGGVPAPAGEHVLRAQVRDASGPLAGARARLMCEDSVLAVAASGPAGELELRCRAPFEDVRIQVLAAGHPTLERSLGDLAAGASRELEPLVMIPGVRLVGRAESSLGRSLGIVDVRVEQRRGDDTWFVADITGRDSRFDFAAAPAGPVEVRVRGRDHADAHVTVEGLRDEEVIVELNFQPRLELWVNAADGGDVSHARAKLVTTPGDPRGRIEVPAGNGMIPLRYLDGPVWRLEISAPGYRDVVLEGETREVETRRVLLEPRGEGDDG